MSLGGSWLRTREDFERQLGFQREGWSVAWSGSSDEGVLAF